MNNFDILPWDSQLFGFNVAKILPVDPKLPDFEKLFSEMKKQTVKLAYWQTSLTFDQQKEISKRYNGLLVDLKTTYSKILSPNVDAAYFKTDMKVIPFSGNLPDDNMYNIALQCGEYSRFRVDPKISYSIFEKLYKTWIEKSASKELADDILIYKIDNNLAGLITVYVKDFVGHIGLVGVDSNYRGQGIGNKLISASENYFKKAKCKSIEVITQGLNKAACTLYEKNDFSIKTQTNFYHFWIND
jgi:dTDP-4-amino-4,6-dideoxy-D-galactose acyltransferase